VGDTAGTLDNIVSCKLYRPGSVGFVSKSGGMSNEMYNVLSRTTDGLYEGEQHDAWQVLQSSPKHICAAREPSQPAVAGTRQHSDDE